MFDIKISGIASHAYGTVIPINNLDFWKKNDPKGLVSYMKHTIQKKSLIYFKKSFYISDSEVFSLEMLFKKEKFK